MEEIVGASLLVDDVHFHLFFPVMLDKPFHVRPCQRDQAIMLQSPVEMSQANHLPKIVSNIHTEALHALLLCIDSIACEEWQALDQRYGFPLGAVFERAQRTGMASKLMVIFPLLVCQASREREVRF